MRTFVWTVVVVNALAILGRFSVLVFGADNVDERLKTSGLIALDLAFLVWGVVVLNRP